MNLRPRSWSTCTTRSTSSVDGSRVNAVVSPVALDGSLLTIRKFANDPFTRLDLQFPMGSA